jgi:hypothetical protein
MSSAGLLVILTYSQLRLLHSCSYVYLVSCSLAIKGYLESYCSDLHCERGMLISRTWMAAMQYTECR